MWLRGLCTVVHPKLWSCKYCMSVVACGCFLDVSNTVYCMPEHVVVLHARAACGCYCCRSGWQLMVVSIVTLLTNVKGWLQMDIV